MDEQVSQPLNIDVILGRHPEHGFVIDGIVAVEAEAQLRRLGYDRNADGVLTLRPDLDDETARAHHVRAAQVLAATGHCVMVLPDDEAARHAGAAVTPHGAPVVIDRAIDDVQVTE